ncbi:hypothetical protein M0R72_06570 [Candidatus Pacearchaeota archaeon]|jgi:hypothetical protein|nr:hypothetical protein [Candidatus Pacearchaeota archaeon]
MTPEELIKVFRNNSKESSSEYSTLLWNDRAECITALLNRATRAEKALGEIRTVSHIDPYTISNFKDTVYGVNGILDDYYGGQ